MNSDNIKGFTLVELLAVIVILAIIVLIAINKIKDSLVKSDRNALVASAQTLVKSIEGEASSSRLTNNFYDGVYTISELFDMGLNVTGDKPTSGEVAIINGSVYSACFNYTGGTIKVIKGEAVYTKSSCVVQTAGKEFAYTGDVESYTIPMSGDYKLEVWGAQGGNATDNYAGGYGAYSVGIIHFNAGDTVYVNVGGQGGSSCQTADCDGGYNGGGIGKAYTGDRNNYVAGGGGATTISTNTGIISDTSMREGLLIAAGGGAGAYHHTNGVNYSSNGGAGGGASGADGIAISYTSVVGRGGSQTAGGAAGYRGGAGSMGLGGSGSNGSSGGGGGYYGGGSSGHSGSGGGSGYLNASKLTSASMYCFSCPPSASISTKTLNTNCVDENPTSECAKMNDGYAKISLNL